MNEWLQNKISVDKEVISVLPQNSLKNKKNYIKKLEELSTEYTKYKDDILLEIKRRNTNLKLLPQDSEIGVLENKIKSMKSIMYLYNDLETPKSKLGIDVLLCHLKEYNNLSLEDVNNTICKLIESFSRVNVDIVLDDFRYSIFAYEYMKFYLVGLSNGDYNTQSVNEQFETVYWKCPDLIMHIKLCFEYLYYKNIKKFDEYIEKLKNSYNFDQGIYNARICEYNQKISMDITRLLAKFSQKELNIKDYTQDKVLKALEEITDIPIEYAYDDLQKLAWSLDEYKGYLSYKFLVEDMKKMYEQRSTFKDCTKPIIKEISKKEKQLFKYNKKLFKLWNRFNKENKINKISIDLNNLLKEIDVLYTSLVDNLFKETFYKNINESSTIQDVLELCCADYNYFAITLKSKDENVTELDIEKARNILANLVTSPYNAVINNTAFLANDDLKNVIKNKYNLMNIKINDGNLEEDNLKNFIDNVNYLLSYKCITNSPLTTDDILFILESDEILKENK